MEFRYVADNLRQSFRALAIGRQIADVVELPGLSIASLGVSFQMFNAAFLSEPVETQDDFEARLLAARHFFDERGLAWALWICEDWLSTAVQRRLSRSCQLFGLRLSAEMPGMMTEMIRPPVRNLPQLQVRRVETRESLNDFRAVGSTCFHVPLAWFAEVFDENVINRRVFQCWVGYEEGAPVSTAAAVAFLEPPTQTTGIYNVATAPEYRGRGYGEAITRHVIGISMREGNSRRIILQSTSQGQRLYTRMGFEPVTRVLVYSSFR